MSYGHLFIKSLTRNGFGSLYAAEPVKLLLIMLATGMKPVVKSSENGYRNAIGIASYTQTIGKLIMPYLPKTTIMLSAKTVVKPIMLSDGTIHCVKEFLVSSERHYLFPKAMICTNCI